MDELERAQTQLGKALVRAKGGEDRALGTRVREEGERLVRGLSGMVRLTRTHSLENEAFHKPMEELANTLRSVTELLGAVHLVFVEDQVYLNDVRIRIEDRDGGAELGPHLARHGIGGITFHAPLPVGPLKQLVAALAEQRPRPRHELVRHLESEGLEEVELFGIFRFVMKGEEAGAAARHLDARVVGDRVVDVVEEAWDNLGRNRLPNPLPVRRAVAEMLRAGMEEGVLLDHEGASPHGAHTLRVCRTALVIGQGVGLGESALQDLAVSAVYHDVGYATREGAAPGVPGYAPPFERHASAGARTLLRQQGFHEAKIRRILAVLQHHRDHEGPQGRPFLFSRILRIAEDYDNLTRSGVGAASPRTALQRMASLSGTAYDPVLLQILVNRLGAYPPGTVVKLEGGAVGVAIGLVRSPPTFSKPVVRLLRWPSGERVEGDVRVDLARKGAVVGVLEPAET